MFTTNITVEAHDTLQANAARNTSGLYGFAFGFTFACSVFRSLFTAADFPVTHSVSNWAPSSDAATVIYYTGYGKSSLGVCTAKCM